MVEQDKKPSFAEVCNQMDRAWKALSKDEQAACKKLPQADTDRILSGEIKSGEERIAAYLQAVKAYRSGDFSLNGGGSAEDR